MVELVLDARAELGEGPVWDPVAACLYFVDIEHGRVHRVDPAAGALRTYDAGSMVGAVALTDSGDLVMAVHSGFARLDLATGHVQAIATVERDPASRRMNDGKVDSAGRCWAGTLAFDRQPTAALYRLDPGGVVHTMLTGVTTSNGLDWTGDGRVMYYIDTRTKAIDAFDFDLTSGGISNRRSIVRVPPDFGSPDGLTVDAEGGIWVAFWGGGAVRRFLPDGTLDRTIEMPVTHPTSCTFGGSDLRDLYITSAAKPLGVAERARQPLAGGVFRCRPGVQGRPANRFKG